MLLDRFLEDAFEVDMDLIADGERAVVAGILQHIEEAGIHSGDSAAVLPPLRLPAAQLDEMRDVATRLALRLGVVGLMNVQFAVHDGDLYVLEVNPRASRTVPFIAKAVGVPLVGLAARVMAGRDPRRDRASPPSPRCPASSSRPPSSPSAASPTSTRCSARR